MCGCHDQNQYIESNQRKVVWSSSPWGPVCFPFNMFSRKKITLYYIFNSDIWVLAGVCRLPVSVTYILLLSILFKNMQSSLINVQHEKGQVSSFCQSSHLQCQECTMSQKCTIRYVAGVQLLQNRAFLRCKEN